MTSPMRQSAAGDRLQASNPRREQPHRRGSGAGA
eukprot:CAMPEP_0179333228 /NCGR_PEP_ID=MMETSP0797-20121207/65170_1 /TAXON_ID=47934 /ORGANISM="Dinophysis acuminata, Strain DAEP01" /LENGTH=33 /DNA_ID= /DNA_START= /DNA_END= /DNA_ORIENTATION=